MSDNLTREVVATKLHEMANEIFGERGPLRLFSDHLAAAVLFIRADAAELTRLRADLAQLEQESDAEITALRACLASAEADLSAAQEREGALREALVRLEAMVRILPPDMDEPGSALAQARTALGETQ